MDGSVDAPDAPDEVLEAGDVAIEGNDAPQGPDGATDGAPGGG
jgi:hypothetical protein